VEARRIAAQSHTQEDPLDYRLLPNHRFVIALCSPDGVFETGLPMGPPEKRATHLARGIKRTLSPVWFDGETCAIAAISSDFQMNAAGFLYNPDCVAEREGLYLRHF
jgi:hypothetical protein